MADSHDNYTIVILPHPTSKGHQFRIARRSAKWFGGVGFGLFFVLLALGLHYTMLWSDVAELDSLRSESLVQQAELDRYGELVSDLNGQLDRIKELDVKLRVMTDLNPPPNDEGAVGIGGTESVADQLRFNGKGGREGLLFASETEKALIQLQAEAARQEASLTDLIDGLSGRMEQWASTPSIWPVEAWLSSGFGNRLSPFTGTIMKHKGIDLATYHGTPIVAPANGRVEYMGSDNGLGKLLVINHGNGIKTLYGHLSKTFVRRGQEVKRGDSIAAVGNTGLSTGSHLHYEVRVNGAAVNPLRYIVQ